MPAFSYPTSSPALANEGQAVFNVSELLRTNFAVAGTPLGSMTQLGMIAAAAAESLSGANIGQQFIDVRQFGQWQDGVNCTSTLVAALLAAGSNTQGGTPYPLGIQMPALPDPLGGVLVSAGITQAVIFVPTGVTLRGAGWKTHLTVDPATMTTPNANYHVLDLIGSTGRIMLEEFQLDGNKANITPFTTGGVVLIYASDSGTGPAVTDYIIRNVFVHDLYASAGVEGFGILAGGHTGFLGTRVLIDGCWAYNINGSGISVSGPNPPGSTTTEYIVAHCQCFGNSFNGTTWFQTQYGTQIGCHCVGNTRAGTNIELSNNIQIIGGRKRLNGFGGIQILGQCSQISLNNVELIGNWNGTAFGEEGEVNIAQDTFGGVTSMPQSIYVNNCTITPNQGPPIISHLSIGERGANGTAGQPSAITADDSAIPFKGVFVTGTDVEKWRYTVPVAPFNPKYAPSGLVIRSGASGGTAPNQGGHPSTWTLTNITSTAAPSGAIGANGKTFTQTAANVATSAITTSAFLLAGHRYRIRFRLKSIDANALWEFGDTAGNKTIRIAQFANDLGVWFEGEFIITVPTGSATTLQLVTVTNTASASALGVDYVTSELLPYLGGLSGS